VYIYLSESSTSFSGWSSFGNSFRRERFLKYSMCLWLVVGAKLFVSEKVTPPQHKGHTVMVEVRLSTVS